jgi:organic hydroperoxide reductase OsmC/OhrA
MEPNASAAIAVMDVTEAAGQIRNARDCVSRNNSGAFALSAALAVTIAGVNEKTAGQLVEGAHATCPYSNAIRGNQIAVSVR